MLVVVYGSPEDFFHKYFPSRGISANLQINYVSITLRFATSMGSKHSDSCKVINEQDSSFSRLELSFL